MKRLLLAITLSMSLTLVNGQDLPAVEMTAIDRFFAFPDQSITLLTESALNRSASVEALMLERDILREDLQLARKDIFSNIAVVGDYLYGNLGTIAFSEGGPPIGVGTGLAGRYTAGIRLSLPFDRLTSRHNRINRVELQMRQAEFNQQTREDEIRQLVIQMYQEVILAKRMLDVHIEARESMNISRQTAERQFREGQIPLSDLSVVNESYTRANIDFQSSLTNYETSMRLLEEVAGVRIQELMSR